MRQPDQWISQHVVMGRAGVLQVLTQVDEALGAGKREAEIKQEPFSKSKVIL